MTLFTLLAIALGLSIDAFAVAVASGIAIQNMRLRHALLIGAFFGGFQALMPLLGWFAGHWAHGYIGTVDHWIAFGLLTVVGVKMLLEARRLPDEEKTANPLDLYVLLTLAVATSIDALAVGLSLSMLNVAIVTPALVIGAITFVLSVAGVYIGDVFGHWFEEKLEFVGGLVLIAIGAKILWQHLAGAS
jgi:manganese efflux pump family protein